LFDVLFCISERIESNSTADTKKEKSIEISKTDNQRKRSTTPLKARNSTGSNTSVRPAAVSPKATSNKERRATADSGPTKVSFIGIIIITDIRL